MHGGNSATVASAVQPGFRKDRIIFIFLKIISFEEETFIFLQIALIISDYRLNYETRKVEIFKGNFKSKRMQGSDRSNFYILQILFEETFQFLRLPRLKRRRYARQCKLFCSFDVKFRVSNFAGHCSFRFIRVTAQDSFAIFMQLDFQAYNTTPLFVLHAQKMILKKRFQKCRTTRTSVLVIYNRTNKYYYLKYKLILFAIISIIIIINFFQ